MEPDDPDGSGGPGTARATTRERAQALFVEISAPGTREEQRLACREELVHLHLHLVDMCARRFRGRGEALEDLAQVGTIGLLNAIDRYELGRGAEFTTYATPTIIGEIKRHFRDKGWAVRVPRRLQELRVQINTATAELTQAQGRSPTAREIAARLDVDVGDVIEGLESANAYATLSLDREQHPGSEEGGGGAGGSILDALGEEDAALENVEMRTSLRPLIEQLPPRQREILSLRFFEGLTQQQIAEQVGVSQMHVSRLLNRTLERLRSSLDAP